MGSDDAGSEAGKEPPSQAEESKTSEEVISETEDEKSHDAKNDSVQAEDIVKNDSDAKENGSAGSEKEIDKAEEVSVSKEADDNICQEETCAKVDAKQLENENEKPEVGSKSGSADDLSNKISGIFSSASGNISKDDDVSDAEDDTKEEKEATEGGKDADQPEVMSKNEVEQEQE